MSATIDRPLSSIFFVPFILAIVGLLLFMALLNGQRELTVLSLLLLGVAAAAKLWARWSLSGIQCSVCMDKCRAFPGEKLFLKATAENRKILPIWLQARVPVNGLIPDASVETEVTAEAGLLWYQKAGFHWELTAQRRGVHRIGPLGITSGDLFGFFQQEKEMAETLEAVVYPRLVPLKMPTLPRRDFFGIPGAKSPIEDPVFILGTRDYQHGRPAKHIHWKATARHNQLQEKIFEPSAQEKVLLVIDVTPCTRQGAEEAFERLLEATASAAVRLFERGCAVGLITNGRMTGNGSPFISVTRNPRQLSTLLETLARVQMFPAQSLIDTLRQKWPWGISCLYFSLDHNDAARIAKEYFMQRRIPFLFFIGHSFFAAEDACGEGALEDQEKADLFAGEGLG